MRFNEGLISLQFSNLRTFLAGIRTAAVLVSLGYAVTRFALYLDEHHANRTAATYLGGIALMFVGIMVLVLDLGRYRSVKQALDHGLPPRTHEEYAFMLAALIAATALLLMVLLFVSR